MPSKFERTGSNMVGYDLSNVAADAGAPSLGARKPSPAGVGIKTPPTNGSSHDINQAVPARNQKEAGVLLGKKAAPWVVAVLPSPAEQRKHQRKHNHQPPPAPSSRLLFFPWGGAGPSCCQAWVMPLAYQGIELFVVSLPGARRNQRNAQSGGSCQSVCWRGT